MANGEKKAQREPVQFARHLPVTVGSAHREDEWGAERNTQILQAACHGHLRG